MHFSWQQLDDQWIERLTFFFFKTKSLCWLEVTIICWNVKLDFTWLNCWPTRWPNVQNCIENEKRDSTWMKLYLLQIDSLIQTEEKISIEWDFCWIFFSFILQSNLLFLFHSHFYTIFTSFIFLFLLILFLYQANATERNKISIQVESRTKRVRKKRNCFLSWLNSFCKDEPFFLLLSLILSPFNI